MDKATLQRAMDIKEAIDRIERKLDCINMAKYISFKDTKGTSIEETFVFEYEEKEELLHFYRCRIADLEDKLAML